MSLPSSPIGFCQISAALSSPNLYFEGYGLYLLLNLLEIELTVLFIHFVAFISLKGKWC
jgi:hypothetical protein